MDKKIILYSGNIGKKQGLELVLEVAERSIADESLHYVICGEGAAKQQLEEEATTRDLKNVRFLPLQPYADLPKLLSLADVHLVIQNPGVADAVLPSKLTNILAVGGNAVITTDRDTEMGILIDEYDGIAVMAKPQNAESLFHCILIALDKELPNKVAKSYACQNLDKEVILRDFQQQILNSIIY